MKTTERESIKIGFPINSTLSKDAQPIQDLLEMEGPEGRLQSRFLPNTVLRPLRVRDIGKMVKGAVLELGILADDTALETDLEFPNALPLGGEIQSDPFLITMTPPLRKPLQFFPIGKIMDLSRLGQRTKLMVMVREEELEKMQKEARPFDGRALVTSYPNTVSKYMPGKYLLIDADGQVESLVRNRDMETIRGGVDVVRKGESMRSFRLAPYATLTESSLGLWSCLQTLQEGGNELNDIIKTLKEKLQPFASTPSQKPGQPMPRPEGWCDNN